MRKIRGSWQFCAWVVGMALAACPGAAMAQKDYSDKDLSVRLAPAFIRFTEVSATGGPTVANRYSSAINPASADWFHLPGKLGMVLAPYYSYVGFGEGTDIHVIGESLTWDTRAAGTFQPTISQVRSNQAETRQGLGFHYDVDTAQLQWAKRFGDCAFGAMFNYANAQIIQKLGDMTVAEGNADSYRFRIGGLYEPVKKLLTGAIFEYGFQNVRSENLAFTRRGPTTVKAEDIQHQFLFRPGISYEYATMSNVFFDYSYGAFINDRDSLVDQRFSTGIEHRVFQWLLARAGAGLDVRGNPSWTAGASLFLAEWCSLDVGYHYDMLPELHPEFGRSHIVQATFNVRF